MALFARTIVGRRLPRVVVVVAVVFQVVMNGFRPDDYNSDTRNYASYLDLLSNTQGLELLFATKFEPLHLGLAVLAGDFRTWAILEGIVSAILVGFLCFKVKRLETLAIILGAAIPLQSSSIRFSVGILSVAMALLLLEKIRWRPLFLSMAGGATHVSLLVAGLMARRNLLKVVALLGAFSVVAAFSAEILVRSGADEDHPGGGTGLRPLLTLLVFFTYLVSLRAYKPAQLLLDTAAAIAISLIAAFYFPVLNRWLVLFLVICALSYEPRLVARTRSGLYEGSVASLLFGILSAPSLWATYLLIESGDF
jgi:hypothetical protein